MDGAPPLPSCIRITLAMSVTVYVAGERKIIAQPQVRDERSSPATLPYQAMSLLTSREVFDREMPRRAAVRRQDDDAARHHRHAASEHHGRSPPAHGPGSPLPVVWSCAS